MPRTKPAVGQTAEPKKSVERKRTPIRRKAVAAAADSIPQFDLTAYHDEIAEAAYLNWLQRSDGAGSPEEDWLRAESAVRIKHAV
jgi:hypothetical protein